MSEQRNQTWIWDLIPLPVFSEGEEGECALVWPCAKVVLQFVLSCNTEPIVERHIPTAHSKASPLPIT